MLFFQKIPIPPHRYIFLTLPPPYPSSLASYCTILVFETANLSGMGIFFWNHILFCCYFFQYASQLETDSCFPPSKRKTVWCRTAVNWVFGDISTYFALLDFKRNLKIGLSPVGKLYSISALLRNALTCLYGNTTSTFFNLDPPTIEEYFQY